MTPQVIRRSAAPTPRTFPRPGHLLLAAILLTLAAAYCSMIPLHFRATGFDEALDRFSRVPFMEMSVYGRADWVANLVLFVPLGFLWIGAADLDRRSRWSAVAMLVPIMSLLTMAIVGIEFAQVWFPPRTVSQNDMLAEIIGSVVGIAAWFAVGRLAIQWLRDMLQPDNAPLARQRLLQIYAVALCLYSLLPLDIALRPSELMAKYHRGLIVLIPFSRGWGGGLDTVLHVVKNIAFFFPMGLLFRMGWDGGKWARLRSAVTSSTQDTGTSPWQPRSLGAAAMLSLALALAIEFCQLFIFTSRSDLGEALLAGAGGGIGAALTPFILNNRGELILGGDVSRDARRQIALFGSLALAVPVAVLLWMPLRFTGDWETICEHASYFLNWPFQRYYYIGEWSALAKVVYLMAAFVPLGALLRWGFRGVHGRWVEPAVLVITLSLFIDLGRSAVVRHRPFLPKERDAAQVVDFQPPPKHLSDDQLKSGKWLLVGPTPDVTDFGAPVFGGMMGWWGMGMFLGREEIFPSPLYSRERVG